MTLGECIKFYREKRGLSQRLLAKTAGLSHAFISKLESEEYEFSSKESLDKIANVLRIKPQILYDAALSKKQPTQYIRPQGINEIVRELQTNFYEVPIVAELHMPGEILEYIYIPRTSPGKVNYVGVKAKGYCLSPDILDGDTLIIDKDATPESGKTILCYHNGHEHPELFKFKNKTQLTSCEIYGVVIGIFRRM